MLTVRRSGDRGYADHGWLRSFHTFSFADYYDPAYVQFRSLRVINEDRVMGGMGFGRDMEIISYVVSGALEHQDSMGNRAVMKAGDVQRISAGSGITHSEYNGSAEETVHFLQIWIIPDETGVTPEYAERSFGDIQPGSLNLIASKFGEGNSLKIHQDASVYVAKLDAGSTLEPPLAPGRAGWVQVIDGDLDINGTVLSSGDAASLTDEPAVRMNARSNAHILFFDLN